MNIAVSVRMLTSHKWSIALIQNLLQCFLLVCGILYTLLLNAVQLTDIKAMLGCTAQTLFLLGCISQLQDGTYYLEDMTGSIKLDLANCQTSSGLYTGKC